MSAAVRGRNQEGVPPLCNHSASSIFTPEGDDLPEAESFSRHLLRLEIIGEPPVLGELAASE